MPFPYFGLVNIAKFTYLIPNSQALLRLFPHEKKVVIALDNEFCFEQEEHLLRFCENADILIWDGMYTDGEIENKKGWGHSTIEQAVYFAEKSDVKKTVICHHSPTRSDAEIDAIKASLSGRNVEFGIEGTKFSL